MRYIIEKNIALKVFYYFMAIDGEISRDELQKLDDIIVEIAYEGDKAELVEECENYLASIGSRDEAYDYILETIDKALKESDEYVCDGIVRRLLVWNLYALSFSDGNLADAEKRIINHIGRVLEIDKSVLLDMEQLIQTAFAIMKELEVLNVFAKPYAEIRPLVDELESRKQVIVKAAKELIEDDCFVLPKKKEKNKAFAVMGKKLSSTVAPKAASIGEKAQKGLKTASNVVGEVAVKGAMGMKEGAGKIFDKFKKTEIKLPDKYKKIKGKFLEEMGFPEDAFGYEMVDEGANALIVCFDVDEAVSMPFNDNGEIIRNMREMKNPNEGLVEVNSGETKSGAKYVYVILKHAMVQEDGVFVGTEYTMNINVQLGSTIKFLNASFMEQGETGMRDTVVYELLRRDGRVGENMEGWSVDPYDESYTEGFLMNVSECALYDEMFPLHPLSAERQLIKYIVENN